MKLSYSWRETVPKVSTLKFGTKTVQLGLEIGHGSKIRVNWKSDVFLPRAIGIWLRLRISCGVVVGPMQRLAIDPTNSFWTDELK
jgi:hypothetical protein